METSEEKPHEIPVRFRAVYQLRSLLGLDNPEEDNGCAKHDIAFNFTLTQRGHTHRPS